MLVVEVRIEDKKDDEEEGPCCWSYWGCGWPWLELSRDRKREDSKLIVYGCCWLALEA